MAVRAIEEAAIVMESPLSEACVAIVGGAGAIGAVCAEMLGKQAKKVILIGRNKGKLNPVAARVRQSGCQDVVVSDQISDIIEAHFIITVTSAVDTLVEPQHLRPGSVVCDVTRP